MNNILEVGTQQTFVLRVGGQDHNVEFPVTAVAKLEKQLGRGMRSLADWLRITAEELPAILEAGLEKTAPEKAKELAESVCSVLPAEEIEVIIEALCTTTFPKATERYRAAVEEMQKRIADSLVPAPPSASASVVEEPAARRGAGMSIPEEIDAIAATCPLVLVVSADGTGSFTVEEVDGKQLAAHRATVAEQGREYLGVSVMRGGTPAGFLVRTLSAAEADILAEACASHFVAAFARALNSVGVLPLDAQPKGEVTQ